MQQTLLILALVAAVLAALWLFRRPPPPPAAHRPKTRGVESLDTLMAWQPTTTRVLSIPECQAYHLLRRALPEHMILAQVPLARFLKVPTRHSYAEWLDLERGALDDFGANGGFETRDPPPSTWFDELDSVPMPLGSVPGNARR
jgi:hypothetical protein